MIRPSIFFVVNFLQDVNVLRPLTFLAARETDAELHFLVTTKFAERDTQGTWTAEIAEIAKRIGAEVHTFASAAEAFRVLQGGRGILIAGSESDLSAHRPVHDVLRVAPTGYRRVTLQHGLECVGFLQNREHVISHGENITFAADVVCTWLEPERLLSLHPSQRAKVLVTGPPSLLERHERRFLGHLPELSAFGGLVCENLHSVRMHASGEHGRPFMDTFGRFCDLLGQVGEAVTLRPHPGGQHVLKNRVALAPNVSINNLPIYQVDLAAYEWGISAPSTVIMDMVLAKLPVAVWQDPDGVMDLSAYAGLVRISSVEDWLRFAHDARAAPEAILARQRQWLEGLGMPLDPALVYDRFTRLLQAGTAERVPPPMTRPAAARCPLPRKILFLANNWLATLQIAFQKPLVGLVANGLLETLTITGEEMRANLPNKRPVAAENKWLLEQVDAFEPDLVVACRYNGPGAEALTDHLSAKGIPLVFVIDDDLLNVPREIGEAKYLAYQNPRRRASLTHLLSRADLVFASTPRLKARLRESGFRAPMVAGRIFCAGEVLRPSQNRPVTKIGYMGGADHAHDFTIALPALVECLRVNPHLFFDLFSSMPMPTELASLGPRIRHLSAVIQDYGVFMRELAALEWDIGLCPLAMTPFNMTKNNNKWIEYTAAGAAVVASGGLVYDKCGSDGCAMLVGPDGWGQALQSLIDDPALRHAQVQRAQHRLREEYSEVKMTEQVLEVFDIAMNMPKAQASWPRPSDQAVAAHPIAIPITASHSKSPQVAS